jgi:hypothetical protein
MALDMVLPSHLSLEEELELPWTLFSVDYQWCTKMPPLLLGTSFGSCNPRRWGLWSVVSFHSGHFPASTSCRICPTSLSLSCPVLRVGVPTICSCHVHIIVCISVDLPAVSTCFSVLSSRAYIGIILPTLTAQM